MEALIKTPVEVIQELLALHTTRKEVSDKLKAKRPGEQIFEKLISSAKQSDDFIAELMNELSNYGDAVMASVDHDNEYQLIWKDTVKKIDSVTSHETEQVFILLESSLKKFYQEILKTESGLPGSVNEMLNKQLNALE